MSPSLRAQYLETLTTVEGLPEQVRTSADFVKFDKAKPQLSLIDPLFVTELGEVLTFGAAKYSPDNWKLCPDPARYKDALLRHIYAYLSGELIDPDSGLPHTSAIAFNTMALRWFDRNPPKEN